MSRGPWGEHPDLPPRLRVVTDCGHGPRLAEQTARIAELEQSVRDWREVARRHHDIAADLQRALESHERECHALGPGSTHWTTEETP